MKICVQVTPRAAQDAIKKMPDGSFKIWVRALPVKGQANRAVADLLASYFGVGKGVVRLVSGFSSRSKMFEIDV